MKAIAILVVLAFGSTARADDAKTKAAAHYREGKAFQDAKQYDQAIAAYKDAYAIDKLPSHLYNIAVVYELKLDPENALAYYKQYLEADAKLSKDSRKLVLDKITTLTAQVEALIAKRKADEEAARIEAERKKQEAEKEQHKVAAANHVKQAEAFAAAGSWRSAADEYRAAMTEDDDPSHLLAAGEALRKVPDLEKAREAYQAYLDKVPTGAQSDRARATIAELTAAIDKARADQERAKLEQSKRLERERLERERIANAGPPKTKLALRGTLGLLMTGVGIAGAVGVGSVLGVQALRENNDARSKCTKLGTCNDEGRQLLEDARSHASSANIAIAVGSGVAIAGVVLWLTAPRVTVTRKIGLVPTGNGAAVVGRF